MPTKSISGRILVTSKHNYVLFDFNLYQRDYIKMVETYKKLLKQGKGERNILGCGLKYLLKIEKCGLPNKPTNLIQLQEPKK